MMTAATRLGFVKCILLFWHKIEENRSQKSLQATPKERNAVRTSYSVFCLLLLLYTKAMASLVITSSNIRKGIVGFIVFAILIAGIDTARRFLDSSLNPFNQNIQIYPDPTPGRASIPELKLTSNVVLPEGSQPTFLVEGAFPSMPTVANVYTIESPIVKLDTVDNAKRVAGLLGFTATAYVEANRDELVWENTTRTRTLTFNKATYKWSLRTQYFFDAEALKPKTINDLESYKNVATSVLSSLDFSDNSFQRAPIVATLAKLGLDGYFTNPVTSSFADYVDLQVYRNFELAAPRNRSELPSGAQNIQLPNPTVGRVYTANPKAGSFSAVVSNDGRDLTKELFSLDFFHYEYAFNKIPSRYPTLTAAEAWDQVRLGKGALMDMNLQTADYFAAPTPLNARKFTVDAAKTEIAYYEPNPWLGYIHPIYIFRGRVETTEGKVGYFVFYMDAIRRFTT